MKFAETEVFHAQEFRVESDGQAIWVNIARAINRANGEAEAWWDAIVASKLKDIRACGEFAAATKLQHRRAETLEHIETLNGQIADVRKTCAANVAAGDAKSDPRAAVVKMEDLRREVEGLRIVLDALDMALPRARAAAREAAQKKLDDICNGIERGLKKEEFTEEMFFRGIQELAFKHVLHTRKCARVWGARRAVDTYIEEAVQKHAAIED